MENKPKTRLVKGSEQAKQYMKELRAKRGANKNQLKYQHHHQHQHNQLKYQHNQNLNQEKI